MRGEGDDGLVNRAPTVGMYWMLQLISSFIRIIYEVIEEELRFYAATNK